MVFPHSVEDETSVEFENAEVVESDAPLVRDMSIRTTPPYQSTPEQLAEWGELLRSLKTARDKPKREKEFAKPLSVVHDYKLTASPKRYVTAAEAMGMEVRQHAILVWHPPVYQESDGKVRKDGSQVMAGQMVTEATEKVHLTLEARHPKARLGFQGFWVDGRFVEAFIHDPVGLLETLEFDYSPDARERKADPLAVAKAERWNSIYNDGEVWTVNTKLVSSGSDFDEWLDEWAARLAPDLKPLTRKKRVADLPEETTDEQLLGGAEWHA